MSLAPRERLSAGRLAGVLFAASVFLASPHFTLAAAAPEPQAGLNASDGEAYLGGQVAAAERALGDGREADAIDAADRTLSLVASLRNPEAAPQVVAVAVSRTLKVLVEAGEGERAWGLYRAAGADVARALPPGPEMELFRATEARLLQQGGELAGHPLAAALALPPGPERQTGLLALGRSIRASALAPGADRRWNRPEAADRMLVAAALSEVERADPETAFVLIQLAGRTGPTFDADALTVLAQARDELQRRTIHQALRLTARRDRLERTAIQRVMARAAAGKAPGGVLGHDPEARLVLRDFNRRLADARSALARDGLSLTPPPAVRLAAFQRALGPGEAALAAVPAAGGQALVCVRRDGVTRAFAAVDPQRLKLDTRVVQQALTATHAPSEALDAQFPAEAAARLYDALVRPVEGCLKPGDRILWLAGAAGAQVPLAALLPAVPPKLEHGYDLARADWLVRRHAIAYAGSAGVVLAGRSGPRRPGADFDFLGVGDPVLGPGQDEAVLRGTGLSALAPLPETRDELIASARGFAAPRLLMQGDATERALRGEMTGAYRYLSFATHGLVREDLQGLSDPALVLTPVAAGDPLDDGLLTASEIADLNLRAAFVALSACNTANFDLTQMARDLPALASAFAVAGVPVTLGTLWPVDSETGQRVVTGVFERLKAPGTAPADALADAQRAFLDAPPDRARLHPRFWAPFLVLGDGGAAAVPASDGLRLAGVEVLTRRGGEVLALDRSGGEVAARLISDADQTGRHAAAVRLVREGRESWRTEAPGTGAARVLARFGDTLVVGGAALGVQDRYVPVLDLLDARTGATLGTWRGEGLARVDAFPMAAAMSGDRLVVAVAERNLRDPPEAGGGRLHLLAVRPDQPPRVLTTLAAPGHIISSATVTALGERLLVTWSDDQAPMAQRPPDWTDDYDAPYCRWDRTTRAELLDGATGARLASAELPGVLASAAVPGPRGSVLLGGSRREGCGEAKAVVVALDASLKARTVYLDDSLGASDVRALAPRPGGQTLIAASKENVVDYRPPDLARARRANPYALLPFPHTYSGLLVTLGPDGRAGAPRLLDSGSNIYVTALAADADDILLAGAVAGQAAIFRLTEGR
ncbi:CHAT domain-containing protein [Phenylobacterium sp.]|uniref:CHAT domain-containing protein n=1 Tax=Phenylobacterium sp. TaxID=1871053 RepID=UPI00392E0CD6